MSKKGLLVLRKSGADKACYCHRNSQLRSLGRKVVDFCRVYSADEISKMYDGIILVDEDTPMTGEQREAYKKYMPEETWSDDFNWPTALKYTRNIMEPIIDGFPYMVDYATFSGGWRCRWQYYIDLDKRTLEIYKHGLEILCQESDILPEDRTMFPGFIEPVRVGCFPLGGIPEDWLEQCEAGYRKMKIVLVNE